MPGTPLVRSALVALALVVAGRSAQAQQAEEVRTDVVAAPMRAQPDSLRPRTLPTMVITAEPAKASRAGVVALDRENRRLARELAAYDRRANELERKLAYLQGPVTDSLNRQITTLDAATAEARARRLALEARLAALEGNNAAESASVGQGPAGIATP